MEMFQVINITASTPFERGVEYGEQAKEKIDICVNHYYKLFTDSGMDWEDVKNYSMTYAHIVKEESEDLYNEAKGIAQGSGRSFEEIMVVNCRYEITKFPNVPETPECTTATILPESTADNKLYLIKNWDYEQQIFPHIVLLKFDLENGFKAFGITEAGQMLREGMNGYGIGFANNNLQSIHDHFDVGLPATFIRRKLIESKSYEEAENFLINVKRNVSGNTIMAGRDENITKDYETYPGGVNILYPKDGVLTHANHFEETQEIDAIGFEEDRSTRFYERIKEQGNEITLEHIMECTKDHEFFPVSICSHPTNDDVERTKDRMTVASLIMNLTDQIIYVCAGNPCEGEYIKFTL